MVSLILPGPPINLSPSLPHPCLPQVLTLMMKIKGKNYINKMNISGKIDMNCTFTATRHNSSEQYTHTSWARSFCFPVIYESIYRMLKVNEFWCQHNFEKASRRRFHNNHNAFLLMRSFKLYIWKQCPHISLTHFFHFELILPFYPKIS